MNSLRITNFLLAAIALFLLALALRPLRQPAPVLAQSPDTELFVEPGVFLLRSPDAARQVYGKVVVDLTNGRVWGFPTLNPTLPYPADPTYSRPQTSHPFEIGRFALEDMKKFEPEDLAR